MSSNERPLCSKCGMEGGFISNLPEYGKYLGFKCYMKSIHPVKRVIEIFRKEFEYRKLFRPMLPK